MRAVVEGFVGGVGRGRRDVRGFCVGFGKCTWQAARELAIIRHENSRKLVFALL